MTKIMKRRARTKSGQHAMKSGVADPRWPLQEAKARFSELVRRARSEGPQRVTVHGREAVVVMSEETFRRLTSRRSGKSLISALQASPCREVEIEPPRSPMPVRDVGL